MNCYTSNNLIQFTATVLQASNNQPINATMICKVRTPDGIVNDISGTIQNPSVGNYTATFLPGQYGVHQYEFIGTNTVEVAAVGQFMVNPVTF